MLSIKNDWYEVDLRSRKDGDTVEVIYSGPSYKKAWKKRNAWFKKNIPDWDDSRDVTCLIDGSDGLFAYVVSLDKNDKKLGLGEYSRTITAI